MWGKCFGALSMPENQGEGKSSTFADNGTASHTLASWALTHHKPCTHWLGHKIEVNGVTYGVDEERCEFVQLYVDEVERRAMGGHLLVEQWVDISKWFGSVTCEPCDGTGVGNGDKMGGLCKSCRGTGLIPQGGTSDAIIIQPAQKLMIVDDLKYGTGEKVFAPRNYQGMSYALGALALAELFGEVEKVIILIHQPRISQAASEWECSIEDLLAFGEEMRAAVAKNYGAMGLPIKSPAFEAYLHPDEKTCRWCKATASCPKLAKRVAEEVRMDFDTVAAIEPTPPRGTEQLSKAFIALPLVELWCRSVKSEVHRLVASGEKVLGPDEMPLKYVEGDEGKREWTDELAAEAALLGQLTEDKAYAPRKIITAPAAGKILDKKKTKAIWEEVFTPLIKRKKGQAVLALGSDPRPPATEVANAEDFDDEITA